MKTVAYRSFVVRVWSSQGVAARALLEEIQSGARSELRGERAARLGAALDASLPPEPGDGLATGRDQTGSLDGYEASPTTAPFDRGKEEVRR